MVKNKIIYGTRQLKINYKLSNDSHVMVNLSKDSYWRIKLLKLIIKILWYAKIKQSTIEVLMNKHFNNNSTDKEIFKDLRELVKIPVNTYDTKYNINKAYNKWKLINTNINININSVLDYGGNVGDTAYAIGREILKLPKDKVFVVDVNEWAGIKWTPRNDISFVNFNNMDTIKSNSIDLITVFHSLHHIKESEYNKILNMFNRVLTKNGIIVLYEHNNNNIRLQELIDIQHCLYDNVMTQKLTYNEFIETFYAQYLNINKWEQTFSKYFKLFNKIEMKNIDNSVYLFFKKLDN